MRLYCSRCGRFWNDRVQTNRKEEEIGDCVVLEVVVVGQMLSIKTLLVLLIRPVVNMEILNADQVVTLTSSQLNDGDSEDDDWFGILRSIGFCSISLRRSLGNGGVSGGMVVMKRSKEWTSYSTTEPLIINYSFNISIYLVSLSCSRINAES